MLFFKKKKKEELIDLYIVSEPFNIDANGKPPIDLHVLCFTKNPDDAYEYIDKLLYIDNKEHFKLWCDLRKLDYKDNVNWFQYCEDCLTWEYIDNKYQVNKISYTLQDIATLFRVFNKCKPLGCSFEDTVEWTAYVKRLADDLLADPEIEELLNSENIEEPKEKEE